MKGELSRVELASRLSLDERRLSRVVKGLKRLDEKHGGGLLESVDGGTIKLREGVRDYWNHLSRGGELRTAGVREG